MIELVDGISLKREEFSDMTLIKECKENNLDDFKDYKRISGEVFH